MRVLSLSLDTEVLETGSAVSKRLLQYGAFLEKLDVVVPYYAHVSRIHTDRVTAWGTGGRNKLVSLLRMFFLCVHLSRKHRYGVVTTQDAYFLGLCGLLCARLYGAGFEVQAHGIEKDSHVRRLLASFVYRHADVVRVVSERLKNELVARYTLTPEACVVIPIYVDTRDLVLNKKNSFMRPFAEEFKTGIHILSVGRLVKVKNHALQLLVLQKLLPDYPSLTLHIVGDGPLRKELESRVVALELSKHVVFHGYREREVLGGLFLICDVFLHTSDSEGYGMVFIEALEAGVPMVIPDVGCAGSEIKEGNYVHIFEPGNVVDCAEALRAHLSKPKPHQKNISSQKSLEEILQHYKETWESINTR